MNERPLIVVGVDGSPADVLAESDSSVATVPVDVVTRPGPAAKVLLGEAAGADELVVGHRGRGGFAGVVLGSVGLQSVLHARCPVTVVPLTTRT